MYCSFWDESPNELTEKEEGKAIERTVGRIDVKYVAANAERVFYCYKY